MTLWLPVFMLRRYENISNLHLIVSIAQIVLLVISLLITYYTVYRISLSNIFNFNIKSIFVFNLLSYITMFAGKFLILPVLLDIHTIESSAVLTIRNILEILEVQPTFEINLFIIGGVLIWTHVTIITGSILTLSIERTFASYFINDYERVPRKWISILLVSSNIIFTILVTSVTILCIRPFFEIVCFNIIAQLAAIMVFLSNRFYTINIVERLKNNSNYSLATRFQTVENLRAEKMIARLYFFGGIGFLTCFITFYAFYSNRWTKYQIYFLCLIESIVLLYPLLVCPIFLISLRKVPMNNVSPQNANFREEADVYFKHLTNSWR
ncbi:unnamed protein product [Caenorhabditis angaria]|uniref:Uncharacterized protein n=1 Tax=Caenorhabditis angaria TaxID=860376 RepID=A0A9P1IBX7_9PELO|nr:unnamed protein product [Caenorhabditis angaria]